MGVQNTAFHDEFNQIQLCYVWLFFQFLPERKVIELLNAGRLVFFKIAISPFFQHEIGFSCFFNHSENFGVNPLSNDKVEGNEFSSLLVLE